MPHEAVDKKKSYNAAVQAATQILESIDSDPAWDWAANKQNQDVLRTMEDTTRTGLTQFGRQYLLEEKSVMVKRFKNADKQAVEFDAFNGGHEAFDALAKKAMKLLKKHGIECEDKEENASASGKKRKTV